MSNIKIITIASTDTKSIVIHTKADNNTVTITNIFVNYKDKIVYNGISITKAIRKYNEIIK